MKRTHEEIEKFIADELEFGLIEEADVAAERARLAPRHKFKEWTYDELVGAGGFAMVGRRRRASGPDRKRPLADLWLVQGRQDLLLDGAGVLYRLWIGVPWVAGRPRQRRLRDRRRRHQAASQAPARPLRKI